MSEPHRILGVSKDAPETVVDAAYRALAKEKHPDQGGDPGEFTEIKEAYDTIKSGSGETNTQTPPSWFDSVFSSDPANTISVIGDADSQPTVEGDIFTVRLKAILPDTDAAEIARLPDDLGKNTRRTVVLFDIENNTDDVQKWHRDKTTYIDKQGFTYEREETTIDSEKLGSRWTHFSVEIEARARTYFVAMVEELPPNARLGKIVHSQYSYAEGRTSGWTEGKERYEFVIEEGNRTSIPLPPER
ncbi:DnaJ domain-containing protein [Halorubellus sp. PRR65]|uniref:DnaJ domain-containing protein n=1 Tax=Halorubellus sp. PRR65 TaxID=3098148 RepID=UPI002B25DAA4|nr:DnaJ domain-containing protein [Halorubellus sp. PRR65]